jgi:hypothetical protein
MASNEREIITAQTAIDGFYAAKAIMCLSSIERTKPQGVKLHRLSLRIFCAKAIRDPNIRRCVK